MSSTFWNLGNGESKVCIVSMVMDYGKDRIQPGQWNPPAWDQYKKFLEEAKKIDEMTGQPDCEDQRKAEWMKDMELRMKALEETPVPPLQQPQTNEVRCLINDALAYITDKVLRRKAAREAGSYRLAERACCSHCTS